MNYTEAAVLVRYVRALCPQQKFDEYSADAYHDLLGHYDLESCKRAAAELARRQPFIAPAEIIDEVITERNGRLKNFQYEPGPDDDDPREYLRRFRDQLAAVADGRRPAELPSGGGQPRQLQPLLDRVGQDIPGEERRRPHGPMGVECPRCGALVGKPCRTTLRKRRMVDAHPARIEAAKAVAA